MTTEERLIRRNRTILVGLFAIALVPLLGAFWLYESSRSAAPWATINHGELMNPIRSIGDLRLIATDGATSMLNSGQWWLLVATTDGCSDACRMAVHELRQLHILLGRDAPRVRRGIVELGNEPIDARLNGYPKLVYFTGSAELSSGVYIVDPLGNLVLRYGYTDAGKPVLEDLKKLLRVSHVG